MCDFASKNNDLKNSVAKPDGIENSHVFPMLYRLVAFKGRTQTIAPFKENSRFWKRHYLHPGKFR